MSSLKPWQFTTGRTIAMHMRFVARIVIMACAILFLFHLGGYNPAKYFTKNPIISVITIVICVASVIYYAFSRNFYLPFLGWAVYPCGSLAEKVPAGADVSVNVKVAPNANVIYWASEKPEPEAGEPIDNPWDAYANYENSGVVRADASGNAVLRVRSPVSYQVGVMKKTLSRHIHYRVCRHPGMLSDIKTVFLQ